uniref:G-protein coupled receptors family 1 profile domain-containing protein n=1 Tax=Romanomermis culicivorax TaxID=13658 RepID=A0A915HJ14_ROMCU
MVKDSRKLVVEYGVLSKQESGYRGGNQCEKTVSGTNFTMDANDYYSDNRSSESGEISIDEDWLDVKSAADLADYVLYGFSFPSILANLHVLYASYKLYHRTFDPGHMLVASLTSADALTCAMHQLYVVLSRFVMSQSHVLLSAQMFLTWVSYSASGFSLLLLNVEKFLYFYCPLHYASTVTGRTALTAIAACWTLCTVYAGALLFWAASDCGSDFCLVPNQTMFYWYVILFSILPVLSSAFLSTYLWFVVKAIRRKTQGVTVSTGQQLKTNVFIFTVTAWVVLSWLPARGHYIFLLEDTSLSSAWFGLIANYVLLLSPMVNPILTILVDTNYRVFTKKTLVSMQSQYKRLSRSINVTEETYKLSHYPTLLSHKLQRPDFATIVEISF